MLERYDFEKFLIWALNVDFDEFKRDVYENSRDFDEPYLFAKWQEFQNKPIRFLARLDTKRLEAVVTAANAVRRGI